MWSLKWKKIVLNILPPFITIFVKDRKSWIRSDGITLKKWREYILSIDPRIQEEYLELFVMVEDYLGNKDFQNTSKYWRHLVRIHLKDLLQLGVDRYGEKVARHYASWADFNDNRIQNLVSDFKKYPDGNLIDLFKTHAGFSPSASIKHNVLIELLLRRIINDNLLLQLETIKHEDFLFGNHPFFVYQNHHITLDLLISLIELRSINECIGNESGVVLEFGAGSGRIANIILRSSPEKKYVIADIPPALFISATRLRRVFPNKKVLFVANNIELQRILLAAEWDILLIKPSLVAHFPEKYFQITIAIDCLHEMNNKQRKFIAEMAEIKSSLFYLKIWSQTFIPLDNINLNIDNLARDYFVHQTWINIFNRPCVFPGDYTEICYKMPRNIGSSSNSLAL